MNRVLVRVFLIHCFCVALFAADAPRERMLRLATAFNTADVPGAGSQNFAVAQDERGIIYVGNLAGVLEYDGVRWRLIELPHRATPFVLVPISGGRIVVGSDGDFGYLARDAHGDMHFVSLAPLLPPSARDAGQIDRVAATNDGVVFIAGGEVLHWNGRDVVSMKSFSRDDPPWSVSVIDGHAWIGTPDGLQVVTNRKLQPIAGGELFAHKRVTLVSPLGDAYIVAVRREGLFRFDGKTATPFAPVASARGARDAFIDCTTLPDGRRAIVTRRGGIVVIRDNGDVDEIVDAEGGLPDTDISDSNLASDGALWLANENGVTRVEISSPMSLLDSRAKLRGSVVSIVRHHGVLYAGTTSGLYRIQRVDDRRSRLSGQAGVPVIQAGVPVIHDAPVEAVGHGIVSGWSMVDADDDLIVGTNDSIVILRDGAEPQTLEGTKRQVPYALARSKRDPNVVYVGTDRGLGIARRTSSGWKFEGMIDGVPANVRGIVEDPDGTLWLGTTFNGIVRVDLNVAPPPPAATTLGARVKQFGSDAALVFRIGGRNVFIAGDQKQILTLDPHTGRFTPDPLLGTIVDGDEISVVADDAQGRVWIATRRVTRASRGAGGRYAIEQRSAIGDATSFDWIYPEADGVVWFGSERGLVRYDSRIHTRPSDPPRPIIRSVTQGGKPLVGTDVHPRGGRLRIEVAPVAFDPATMYQYRLDPAESNWSEWTREPFTEFTNLFEGDYRLLVRTRNVAERVSPVGAFAFRVLPPWYRTPWAYALWIALFALLLAGVSRVRTRALRDRAASLEQRVAEQTHELRAANARLEELSFDDPLTGIANRRRLDLVMRSEWLRARRSRLPLGLILIDIDLFKQLNDTHGHQEGDVCLQHVARLLSRNVQRSGELTARYGGEEFAIVLPNTDLEGCHRLAEYLRAAIQALAIPHEGSPTGTLTASFGVASITPSESNEVDDLVASADRALYEAKAAGRNRVRSAA
jgi:diguanylate cyclase (GGDEF)-like protein